MLEMMAKFNAIDNYPFSREKAEENLLHFVDDPNLGRAWTIIVEEVIAGYLILTFGFSFEHNGRDAFIDEFSLKPEYRLKGIGKVVIEFIEKVAFELGINVVHLEVEQKNEGETKLYKQTGFKNNGRILLSKNILKD